MALSKSVRSNKRWPEWWSVIVPSAVGAGSILQLNFVFSGQRFETTMQIPSDGKISREAAGQMLREMAWLVDGIGEDPTLTKMTAEPAPRRGVRDFVARVVGL